MFQLPRFLDVHSMKGLNDDMLNALQKSPEDEFKVKHLNFMFNPEIDKCFSYLKPLA
jgi:hypothetical protein